MALKKLPRICSIRGLRNLTESAEPLKLRERYERLAILAAQNLGGDGENLEKAFETLVNNANETDSDEFDGEQGVVDEINNVRDCEAEYWGDKE
jgi:hypothetical protein